MRRGQGRPRRDAAYFVLLPELEGLGCSPLIVPLDCSVVLGDEELAPLAPDCSLVLGEVVLEVPELGLLDVLGEVELAPLALD